MQKSPTWRELLILGGFLFQCCGDSEFDFTGENHRNIDFLKGLLDQGGAEYDLSDYQLNITSQPLERADWLDILGTKAGKRGELLCYSRELWLEIIDVPLLSVIRQLNRLHFNTRYSCSGHGKTNPVIGFENVGFCTQACSLIKGLGFPCVIASRGEGRRLILQVNESCLPDLGILLSDVSDGGDTSSGQIIRRGRERRLEDLLMIPGASGEEQEVRSYLYSMLGSVADSCTVDRKGNLLAIKCLGPGPTVLLSAHMDTCRTIDPDSSLVKDGSIWRKSSGILGADDRTGAAMIIGILEDVYKTRFAGKIKVALTVDEEIGQRGAENIDPIFFWDVDCAISLDRRNGGDIVTDSQNHIYCGRSYGRMFERVAAKLWNGDNPYQMVTGGISDLKVWSAMGIESVNLSVGFYNEHTPNEYLNLEEWHRTHELVLAALPEIENWVIRSRGIKKAN